jgi:AraC-like DNA-binding protein
MARQDSGMSDRDGRRFQYFSSAYRRRGDGSLFIAMIGGHYGMEPGLFRYHRSPQYRWRLMLFHDPVLLERPDGGRVAAPADSLVLWERRAVPRAYGAERRRWSHSWIACEGSRIDALLAEAALPELTPIPLPGPAVADRTLLGLHHELTAYARPDPGIQESFLRLLLLEARRGHAGDADAADPEGLLWVRRRLDEQLDRPLSLEELARERGMSARHLARRFTATWGMTPAAYHQRARMEHARSILDQPGVPLARVARVLGYADAFAFSKAFKRHTGVSPDAYRGRR